MKRREPIAHPGTETRPDETLQVHLHRVADKARELAVACNPNDPVLALYAYAAGLLHDVGKHPEPWQKYLGEKVAGKNPSIIAHAYHGAFLALSEGYLPLASAGGAHHAGLSNFHDLLGVLRGGKRCPSAADIAAIREWLKGHGIDPFAGLPRYSNSNIFYYEMWTRMLTSILVDADRLATEFNEKGAYRATTALNHALLIGRLTAAIQQAASKKADSDPVLLNARKDLLDACIAHGTDPKGWFTVTGPTGVGKTLSTAMFALLHAQYHKMRRVFVVVPFLTLIDQSARTYRRALEQPGESIVLEHHSNAECVEQDGRLPPATENWDAPMILTTTVQFFESLLACPAGKIRKIHNIAGSVIILDEFQALPPECLTPIMSVLTDLVENWGCTVVLSSASQVDIGGPTGFKTGLYAKATELVPAPSAMFKALQRVTFRFDFLTRPEMPIKEVAQELCNLRQALCVVNTKKQARALYRDLRKRAPLFGAVLHMSANMCADNRLDTLDVVRARLDAGDPCLLVSTQVIEAGCDVDFPVAWRELAPLDSMVQTAGRVNREGKLGHGGGLAVIFTLDGSKIPQGFYKRGRDIARDLLHNTRGVTPEAMAADPLIFERYFKRLLGNKRSLDSLGIQDLRKELKYRTVWSGDGTPGVGRFRLIGEDTISVLVPYKAGVDLLKEFRDAQTVSRGLLRRMQPYLVSIYRGQFEKARENGEVDWIRKDAKTGEAQDYEIAFVRKPWCYDSELGLQLGES